MRVASKPLVYIDSASTGEVSKVWPASGIW
jgi:hypothetical protein